MVRLRHPVMIGSSVGKVEKANCRATCVQSFSVPTKLFLLERQIRAELADRALGVLRKYALGWWQKIHQANDRAANDKFMH
jgi:hypothetical protein